MLITCFGQSCASSPTKSDLCFCPVAEQLPGWVEVGFLPLKTCPIPPCTGLNSHSAPRWWRLWWARLDLQEASNFCQILPLTVSVSVLPLRLKCLCEDDEHIWKVSCKVSMAPFCSVRVMGCHLHKPQIHRNVHESQHIFMCILMVLESDFYPCWRKNILMVAYYVTALPVFSLNKHLLGNNSGDKKITFLNQVHPICPNVALWISLGSEWGEVRPIRVT